MKTWIKVLITVIITAGIVGYGTYYSLNKKATTDKKNLQSQIDDLNKKIADANTALTAAQAATATTATTTTTDPTAGWKIYASSTKHFSVKYPADWIVTAQASQNRVYFGNVAYSPNGEPSDRPANFEQVWISYNPTETAAKQENLLKAGKSDCCELSSTIKTSTISTLTAGLVVNTYEYATVGGSILEAFWANNVGERFKATNSTEVGTANQTNMVANLKKILGTFQFTD